MSLPLISIIIPVYNTGQYLADCLDSCLNQSYKNLEILIIDDASTDSNTLALEKLYAEKDSRVKIVYNQTNRGLSYSRNYGVSLCKGEYFSFLDSDDCLDTDFINTLFSAVHTQEVDFVVCNYVDTFADGSTILQRAVPTIYKGCIETKDIVNNLDLLKCIVTAYPRLFQKDKYLNTGVSFVEGVIYEDNDWFLDFILNTQKFIYVDYNGYIRKIREGSITQSKDSSRFLCQADAYERMFIVMAKHNIAEQYKLHFLVSLSSTYRTNYEYLTEVELKKQLQQKYIFIIKKYLYDVKLSKWLCFKHKFLYKLSKFVRNKSKKEYHKEMYKKYFIAYEFFNLLHYTK